MATIYADSGAATMALFGRTDDATRQYLQNSVNSFMGSLANTSLAQMARDGIMHTYNQFQESSVGRAAQAVRNQLDSFWKRDAIYCLHTLADLQNAPNAMIPYIMAMPEIRTPYQAGDISGYGDRYVDLQPGVTGEDVHEYRCVMDGYINNGKCVHYQEPLPESVRRLTVEEKDSVLFTVSEIAYRMRTGLEDPTSEWNDILI